MKNPIEGFVFTISNIFKKLFQFYSPFYVLGCGNSLYEQNRGEAQEKQEISGNQGRK